MSNRDFIVGRGFELRGFFFIAPWANDTDEPVDDGADLDYEYGPQ